VRSQRLAGMGYRIVGEVESFHTLEVLAHPAGFEPVISGSTIQYVWPLHYGCRQMWLSHLHGRLSMPQLRCTRQTRCVIGYSMTRNC
jgi:hypothetical protein